VIMRFTGRWSADFTIDNIFYQELCGSYRPAVFHRAFNMPQMQHAAFRPLRRRGRGAIAAIYPSATGLKVRGVTE
jgi:hypothetical protein